jgi:hypothetical protein
MIQARRHGDLADHVAQRGVFEVVSHKRNDREARNFPGRDVRSFRLSLTIATRSDFREWQCVGSACR